MRLTWGKMDRSIVNSHLTTKIIAIKGDGTKVVTSKRDGIHGVFRTHFMVYLWTEQMSRLWGLNIIYPQPRCHVTLALKLMKWSGSIFRTEP